MVTDSSMRGVFPVLQTPFDEAGVIDSATLQREIDWVFECGAAGITVGMVSEILRLDTAERRDLAAMTCAMAEGRGPVILSVGAESTFVAVAQAEHAQSVGASAVMAVPPLSVSAGNAELRRYYDAIIAATDVPVVIQDASSYVGDSIPVALLANMLEGHGDRLYFKPEAQPLGPRLSALLKATDGKARVYDGSGGVALIDTFRRGIVGSMPGAEVCWAIVHIWSALCNDDYETAYRVSLPLAALLAMQTSLSSYVEIEKHLLVQQKVFENGRCRGPLDSELDEQTMKEARTLLGLLQASCGRRATSPAT